MNREDLQPLLLVVTPGHEVLKVSTVEGPRVTAELVYPVPPRTSVRTLTPEDVAALRPVSDTMLAKYEQAWGFR